METGKQVNSMKTRLLLGNICLAALVLAGCASKLKVFRSAAGNFSVKAPVLLAEQSQPIDASGGKLEAHTYLAENDDIVYVAAYTTFSAELIASSDSEEQLNNARDSMVQSVGGILLLETRQPLGDYPGRELVVNILLSDGTDGIMKARVYLVKNRLYQVMVLVPRTEMEDESITNFLESFKLIEEP